MVGVYEQIRRRSRTEDRLRKMDMSEIAEEIEALENARDKLLGVMSDLLCAHHHSRGDEYVDAAYDAISQIEWSS